MADYSLFLSALSINIFSLLATVSLTVATASMLAEMLVMPISTSLLAISG